MQTKFEIIETPDYILAVSDEDIKDGNYKYHLSREQLFKIHHFSQSNGSKTFIPTDEFNLPLNVELLVIDCKDVIGHIPKGNAPELDLPLLTDTSIEDEIEKLALNYVDSIRNRIDGFCYLDIQEGFQNGHKAATKVYNEEDLRKAVELTLIDAKKSVSWSDTYHNRLSDELIQSLKQTKTPKWFVSEVEEKDLTEIAKELGIFGHDQGLTEKEYEDYLKLNPQKLKTTTINGKTYLKGKFVNE
jgi:hypothetical protein